MLDYMFTQNDIEFLKQDLSRNKVLVVGDVMLDRYWFGDVERISPEAPVPIAKINKVEDRPGGAANVARNIASLGGNVTLLSVVGVDEPSITLEKLLTKEDIKLLLKKDENTNTILKLRVLAKNQQLIRVDFEETPSHEILAEVMNTFESIIDEFAVVVLSDYGKGGLVHIEKMIDIANAHNKLILVDPKGKDYSKYKNATLVTPNCNELREIIGDWKDEIALSNDVKQLKNTLQLDYLLLTRSEKGMSLFANEVFNYPTFAKEVFDVSGAGDTVIATLGLLLANNAEINDAVRIANLAAGIVVGKLGTAIATKDELIMELKSHL